MSVTNKPSGATYQWKCKYCGRTTRAAHEPSGTSYGKCSKSPTGRHDFVKSGR